MALSLSRYARYRGTTWRILCPQIAAVRRRCLCVQSTAEGLVLGPLLCITMVENRASDGAWRAARELRGWPESPRRCPVSSRDQVTSPRALSTTSTVPLHARPIQSFRTRRPLCCLTVVPSRHTQWSKYRRRYVPATRLGPRRRVEGAEPRRAGSDSSCWSPQRSSPSSPR